MTEIIKEKQKNRFQFLKKLYDEAKGSEMAAYDMQELGGEIGIPYDETSEVVSYLIQEDLIAAYGLGGGIHLTHWGIKEMEQALSEPEKSTEHFMPVNIIQIGTMNNSSVQQATHHSVIHQKLGKEEVSNLNKIIAAIEELQKTLALSGELQEEFISEIQTLKIQTKSPKPKSIVVHECLKSIRNILEGVVGNASAPSIIASITQFMHSV